MDFEFSKKLKDGFQNLYAHDWQLSETHNSDGYIDEFITNEI